MTAIDIYKLLEELEKLRAEKKIWLKVCEYEKDLWINYAKMLPNLGLDEFPEKEKEHVKNIQTLLSAK